MRKVYIVNGSGAYTALWQRGGYVVVDRIAEAEIVQFTGGADVSPSLYGEELHPMSSCHPKRDEAEARLYQFCLAKNIPMAGICRGGQFLNVMNGGSMYQHVNGHALGGTHALINTKTGGIMPATSTHHQMMRVGPGANVLGLAHESTQYQLMASEKVMHVLPSKMGDIEVLFYPATRSLCFQPHPELMSTTSPCRKWYLELVEEHCFGGVINEQELQHEG